MWITLKHRRSLHLLRFPVRCPIFRTLQAARQQMTLIFSVDISFKGKPVLSNVAALPVLNVVSVPGTASGKTSVYVNPILTSGNSYKPQRPRKSLSPSWGEHRAAAGLRGTAARLKSPQQPETISASLNLTLQAKLSRVVLHLADVYGVKLKA